MDIHGAAKAKAVPSEHLEMLLTDGAGFAGFALWGFGMGPHGPDYMAVGDLSTLHAIPWMPGFARMATYGHVHGKPYAYDTRVALKNQLDKLSRKGLTLYTGIEPEFMLLKRKADRLRRASRRHATRWTSPATTTRGSPAALRFLERLVDAAKAVGLDVYQIDHEDGNGQFEVNFTYSDALTTADRYVVFKMAASEIAQPDGHDRDLHAQAVRQPHRHRRAFPSCPSATAKHQNLFHDDKDKRGLGLSKMGYHFLGGLLAHARGADRALRAVDQFLQAAGGRPRAVRCDLGAGLHRVRRQQPDLHGACALWAAGAAPARWLLQSVSRHHRQSSPQAWMA